MRSRFPIVDTLRWAARTQRTQFRRVTLLSLLVLGPLAAMHALVDDAGWTTTQSGDWKVILGTVATALLAGGAVGFGNTLVAGILDHVVDAHREARPQDSLRDIVARLPMGRLVGASALFFVVTSVGLALLVLPGVALYVLLSIAGPLVQIEGLRAVAALRRSAALVRPHFWRVAAMIVPLTLLEQGVVSFIADLVPLANHLVAEIVAEVVALTFLGAYVVLCEVHAASELLALERRAVAAPG